MYNTQRAIEYERFESSTESRLYLRIQTTLTMICLLPKTAQQICGQTFFEQTWLCQPHSMLLDIPYTCFVRVRLCYKTEVLHQLFLLSHCYFGGDDAVLRRSLTLAVLGKCVVIDTTGVCVCVLFIRLCRTTIFFVVRFLQPQFRRRFFFNFFFLFWQSESK